MTSGANRQSRAPAQGAVEPGELGRIADPLGGGSQQPAPQQRSGRGRRPMSMTELVIRSRLENIAQILGTNIADEGGRILHGRLEGIITGR
jgi:hypothetical protein